MKTIHEIVRKAESDFTSGTPTKISRHVDFSLYENINKIDAYYNSKHLSGPEDSQGREKPFFNIVVAAVNIWYRATDIDRKHIRIKATKSSKWIASFIASIYLQEWMKKTYFGAFLNKWGRTLAKYGSAVLKFVEKDGELIPNVISWNKIICDAVDFDNNIKIEKLEFTPAQLRMNESYDQEMVEKLIDAQAARTTMNGDQIDTKNDYIKVYEIHGNLEKSYLTGKESDEDVYQQQMHVISFVASKEKGKFDDFTLYSGKEAKDPYMITHLIEEDDRAMAIGAVEHLFESQWMVNHTAKTIKDQLDLASKLIFQTSDTNYTGRNILTDIENGNILIHEPNAQLTQINNNSHDITSLQNFGLQWKSLAQELTSTPDSLRGNTAPSGTAWRQVEALQQEANSLFELMTENKGLAIEEMMRKFVLPFIRKQTKNRDEIAATLEAYQIDQLDTLYIPNKAADLTKKKVIKGLVEGNPLSPDSMMMDLEMNKQGLQDSLNKLGNQRFIKPDELDEKTWEDIFEDMEWEIEVDVTGENRDAQNVIATLTTVLQTVAGNPAVLQDPNMKLLFNKIISETGAVSPLELNGSSAPTAMVGGPQAPIQPIAEEVK